MVERSDKRIVVVTGVSRRAGISFAVAQRFLRDALADRGITVNAVNPGPVDTGWPSTERERLRHAFPSGRWGRPEDIGGHRLAGF